ncbi:MAG: hypothetical protein WA865_13570 [Spirulinaceae cyanobacterium]
MDTYLKRITEEFEEFKNISLKGSQYASQREALTSHSLEYLVDGIKATLSIENYLGGVYYLTPDEIFYKNGIYIVQESKNASQDSLPKLSDIQDGLFKLILFSNLDSLALGKQTVGFVCKLKLTGKNVVGSIILPNDHERVESFLSANKFKGNQIEIIRKLSLESRKNKNLEVEISNNFRTQS